MKELSIEDKAKRYDEAIEFAHNKYRFSSNLSDIKLIEELFPELKEDEREIPISKQKSAEEYNITGIGSKNAQGKLGEMIKRKLEIEKHCEQKPAIKLERDDNGEAVINKICTSLEQSKKLIELGIDVKTADMLIGNYVGKYGKVDGTNIHYYHKGESFGAPEIINAWSLSALIELLSPFIQQRKFGRYISYWLHMTKRTIRYEYYDESYDGYDYLLRTTDDNDCLLDAVYSAIVKLKEKDLL